MNRTKMTIHRALSELKLIDAKIEKQILEIIPTGIKQLGKLIGGHIQEDVFQKDAQSKYDSVNDLIDRKTRIKSAIVKANGETKVIVAGKEMTIADAITYKAVVKFKKDLAFNLKARYQQSIAALNRNNEQVEKNLQAILEATFGKDNVSVTNSDVEAVREPYIKANEYHLFDPLKVLDKVEAMEKEIDEFEAEVDAVLSEINAVTYIEV